MNRLAKTGAAVVALVSGLALSACGTSSSTTTTTPTDSAAASTSAAPVTMTLWHNATGDKGPAYWQAAVAAFDLAITNVTFNITIV